MLQTIKRYIQQRLFKDDYLRLELARRQPLKVQELTRQQLAGFDKSLLSQTGDVLDLWVRTKADDTKLAEMHQIATSQALRDLLEWLKREQIYHAVMTTENLEQMNFARATVNGLVLLEENIDRLDGIYRQRTETPPTYDRHAIIS